MLHDMFKRLNANDLNTIILVKIICRKEWSQYLNHKQLHCKPSPVGHWCSSLKINKVRTKTNRNYCTLTSFCYVLIIKNASAAFTARAGRQGWLQYTAKQLAFSANQEPSTTPRDQLSTNQKPSAKPRDGISTNGTEDQSIGARQLCGGVQNTTGLATRAALH